MVAVNKTVVEVARTNQVLFDDSLGFAAREKIDWLDHQFVRKEQGRTGPGEFGVPVVLDEVETVLSKRLVEDYSYNVLASDKISLDRAVPDTRAAA